MGDKKILRFWDRVYPNLNAIKKYLGNQVTFGQDLLNGIMLEKIVRDEYIFGVINHDQQNPGNYKHFTRQYSKISELLKSTGNYGQENLRLFLDVLVKDLENEKKLRQFIVENYFQMGLIGIITGVVLFVTLSFFNSSTHFYHIYLHLFVEAMGGFLFYVLLKKCRLRLLGPFMQINQILQSLIIFCSSGLSTQEVLTFCNYNDLTELETEKYELGQFKEQIIKCIQFWRDNGHDCELELKNIHGRMEEHFLQINKKIERIASGVKLGILSIFFLGSYLLNILILLQTFLSDSFYTLPH